MPLAPNVTPEGETAMAADITLSQLVYEEIHDVPASLTTPSVAASTELLAARPKTFPAATHHPYEDVEVAGLQETAEAGGADSYHFTLCSAYGVALDSQL